MAARQFSAAVKRDAWKRCGGNCEKCTAVIAGAGFIYDHAIAWELTRDSSLGNCQVLCLTCNRDKTAADQTAIAHVKRTADFHLGIAGPGLGRSPMACGRYDRDGKPGRHSKTFRHGVVARTSQAEKHRATMASRQF
jgi:5-methylcytosine-specific restriction enzyme A